MKITEILRARLAEVEQKRSALFEELEALPEPAEVEARALNEDEKARANVLKTDIKACDAEADELRSDIADNDAIEARATAAVRTPQHAPHIMRKVENSFDLSDVRDMSAANLSRTEARDRALAGAEATRNFLNDEQRQAVIKAIEGTDGIERNTDAQAHVARHVITTGSETYSQAYMKYISGRSMAMTEAERFSLSKGLDEERSMTSGTGSSGGYFVPVFVDPTMIITGTGSQNPFRDISRVIQIGPAFGGWYGASAAQVTAAFTSENSAAPDNTPTVTQLHIPVNMAEAFVGVSFQAYEDIADLATDVQQLFADAKANLESSKFTTGSGTTEPNGVVTAVGAVTASRVAPTTGGTYGFPDPELLYINLPPRFRRNLAWTANISTMGKTRVFLAQQNSANSTWTDWSQGQPPTLWGYPIYEASTMSSSYTTGQDVLLFGDFSRYAIIDRVGFSLEFVPNLFDTGTGRPTATRGWLAHWRTGADCTDTNAFRLLRL